MRSTPHQLNALRCILVALKIELASVVLREERHALLSKTSFRLRPTHRILMREKETGNTCRLSDATFTSDFRSRENLNEPVRSHNYSFVF